MSLNIINAFNVVKEAKEYVRKRKDGEISSFKTKFDKLNYHLMGGISPVLL